jgi:hypothetical protein
MQGITVVSLDSVVPGVNLLSEGKLMDTVVAIFTAGSLGERIITEASDGGAEVILDNLIIFDLANVPVWAELF